MIARALLAASAAAAGLALAAAAPYREGPPPAHTGGFGEPSCRSCHLDTPGADSARVLVAGLPERYAPGAVYDVVLTIAGASLAAGGFQLAVRHEDGSAAGTLAALDERVRIITERAVPYAQHTGGSAFPVSADTVRWQVRWTAPNSGSAAIFHIATNAANDDDSPLGDVITLRTLHIPAQ